jgi:DNA-binding CsgD family transcriptional regulator
LSGWLPEPQQRALDIVTLQADPGEDVVEPHAVARAFAEALRIMSGDAPVVLMIDDEHWLDSESARAIAFAIRRLAEQRIVIVTAARDDAPRGNDLAGALRSLGERHTVLRLAPLTSDQIEQLLHANRLSLPRASLRYVQDAAAGHPLFAIELARHVATGTDASIPTSLSALLEERLRQLPAETLAVIAAAAQTSAPTRVLIGQALDADASSVDTAIDAAADAQIVVENDGIVRFSHPLLAEAASATTTSGWRREVHRQLARVITDVEQRAVHLSLSHTEPDESVAAAIEAGATRARARAAPEVAAELIGAALRLTPPGATGALRRRRVDGAYHNAAAGRPEAGAGLLLAALADEPDGDGRVDLQWRAAMLHFLAGDLPSCVELLEDAREQTGDSAVRNHLSTRLASMYSWISDFPRAAELADAIDIDQLTEVYRVNAMATVYLAKFGTGRTASMDPWQIIAEFEGLDPRPPAHEHPIARLVHVLTLSEDPARVAEVASRALDRAVDEADDLGVAWLAASLTHAELRAGRWPAAARAADESLRAGQRAGSAPARVFGLGAATVVAVCRGDVGTATRLAQELIALGGRQPLLSCVGQAHCSLGFLALSQGNARVAREEYLIGYESLDREAPDQLGMPPLRWQLVDALIDAGDLAEAQRRIELIDAAPADPLGAAVAASGRARLAALRGDRDAADSAFGDALTAHDMLGWPLERAITQYYQGCALRDQRRRRAARAALTEAAETFTELGAQLWAARAQEALAGISGRAPSSPDALTRTEEEVAKLAASGLTNQQIAERLFVSTKTVATHLSHTYAKLNVRSRTELAARMQRIS